MTKIHASTLILNCCQWLGLWPPLATHHIPARWFPGESIVLLNLRHVLFPSFKEYGRAVTAIDRQMLALSFPMLSVDLFSFKGSTYSQSAVFTGPNFLLNHTAIGQVGLPALTGSNAGAGSSLIASSSGAQCHPSSHLSRTRVPRWNLIHVGLLCRSTTRFPGGGTCFCCP